MNELFTLSVAWLFSVYVLLCRYFVLDPDLGQLHYFVSEQGKSQKPRGSLPLVGASVTQSDEAPHMFVVHSVNGELYKLRGKPSWKAQAGRVGLAFIPWKCYEWSLQYLWKRWNVVFSCRTLACRRCLYFLLKWWMKIPNWGLGLTV